MDNNETIGNMVENPKASLFKMAIPPFVSLGCILLYSFIDSIWISGLGHVEVTAIGITSPIFYLLIIIGTGIGTTVNTTLSKAMAEKNIEKSNSIVKNTLMVIIILSILIPLIILPFLDKILILIGSDQSFNAAYSYLSILIFFIGIFFISDVFPFLLRLQGYIKIPIYISVITSVLNIILDPIFIYSLQMGIEGAAISTVISATIGSILLIIILHIKKSEYIAIGEYNYNKKRDLKVLKKNLRIGIPVILQTAGSAIFLIIVNTFFIYEGLIYITAYSFANKMLSFLLLPLNAFSTSMLSVIGFLIGAGRCDEITPNLKYALYVVEIFTIIPSVFFFIGSDFLSYIFYQTKDILVINQISLSIKYLALLNILQNACLLVDTMFIAIEKPEKPFIIIAIGMIAVFISLYIMEYYLHITNSVYYVLIVSSLIQIPIYYYVFKKDLNEFLNKNNAPAKDLNEKIN